MCFQVTKSIKIYLKFIYKVLFNVICIVAFNEFFLVSKIRDHSDKCSLCQTNLFSGGLSSLELAKLLVNCLKSIENLVNQLLTFHEEAKFDYLEKKI